MSVFMFYFLRICKNTETSSATNGSLTGKRSLMSSCTSLTEQDREIVEKSIREQEKREAESKLIEAERSETGRVRICDMDAEIMVYIIDSFWWYS